MWIHFIIMNFFRTGAFFFFFKLSVNSLAHMKQSIHWWMRTPSLQALQVSIFLFWLLGFSKDCNKDITFFCRVNVSKSTIPSTHCHTGSSNLRGILDNANQATWIVGRKICLMLSRKRCQNQDSTTSWAQWVGSTSVSPILLNFQHCRISNAY